MSNIFFGIPNGICENQIFDSRISLVEYGLHRSTQRGIDGNSIEGHPPLYFLVVMKMTKITEMR